MRTDFSALRGRLYCPDDSTALLFEPGQFCCPACSRVFPVLREGVVELLPTVQGADVKCFDEEYADEYLSSVKKPLRLDADLLSWGAPEAMPLRWVERRSRQVHSAIELLKSRVSQKALICDLSAGAGYYTLALAGTFQTVLHCDLSAENLCYAIHKARRAGLENILFVRADYFALPFCSSVDVAICLDTLIRGQEHERRLLSSITKATAYDGLALIDFHNWWHNPFRRLGLLRQNFGSNRSYTRSEVQHLLRECGITRFDFYPFHQEAGEDSILGALLKRCLPATRFVYLICPGQAV